MKIKFLIVLFVMLIGTVTGSAQSVSKGDVIIDLYYGAPNLSPVILQMRSEELGSTTSRTTSLGPVGMRLDFMLGEKISAGIHANYAQSEVESFRETSFWNGSDFESVTYRNKVSTVRYRIMSTFHVHPFIREHIDTYLGFGMGYAGAEHDVDSADPQFNRGDLTSTMIAPIALRAEFGLRYFFSNTFGAHWNVGAGAGPLISAGLSVKF